VTYDEAWWRANSSRVKARLTRAERNVIPQPGHAGAEARAVRALMDEHGYPDWWSRVDRLEHDARMSELYR
jgi:hypothetical protein